MDLINTFVKKVMTSAASAVMAHHMKVVILSVVFSITAIILIVTKLTVINNTNALIDPESPFQKIFLNYKEEFNVEEDIVLVVRSENAGTSREVARELGVELEKLKPEVTRVIAKLDLSTLQRKFLFFLSPEELNGIQTDVTGLKENLQSTGASLNLNSFLNEVNTRFDGKELRKKDNFQQFIPFIDKFIAMLNQLADAIEGKKKTAGKTATSSDFDFGQLERQVQENEYLTLDGSSLFILVTPASVPMDAAAPYSALTEKIRGIIKNVQAKHPDVKITLTGEPILMDDELIMSTKDSELAGILSFLLVAGLFLVSYKRMSRPLYALLLLIMATLWTMAFAVVSVGHFNIISQACVAMVIGLGVDFGVQIMGRYEEELGKGFSVADALRNSLTTTGVAVFTGGMTTAVAFYTMCFNDFTGLVEFGIIAGSGLVICLFTYLFVLPCYLVWRDLKKDPQTLKNQVSIQEDCFAERFQEKWLSLSKIGVGVAAFITVASICFIPRVHFDHNLLNLQSPKLESVQEVKRLATGDSSIIYGVVIAENMDQVRLYTAQLQKLPTIGVVRSLADMMPENQEPKLPIIKKIVRTMQSVKLDSSYSDKIDVVKSKAQITELLEKSREAAQQAKKYTLISSMAKQAVIIFEKMIPPLERMEAIIQDLSQPELERRLQTYQTDVFGNIYKGLNWLKNHETKNVVDIADIPQDLKQRFYSQKSGRYILEVYPKENIWNREANERFVADMRTVYPDATGTPIQNLEYIDLLRKSYLQAAQYAFIAIVILIALHFRSFKYSFLAILPLLLGVVWTLGLMGLLKIAFNPANIVTLPLVIGVGVAYGVYVVDRYRENHRLDLFSSSTGKAIVLSGLTTLFGFGSLMISSYKGLFSLGMMMSIGVVMCLVASLFILPQLITLMQKKEDKHTSSSREKASITN